ncbi:MAG: holo-ACP synthase [Colwellia sp.]|nr:holo-ACP synthase [Colwellia sp.]
MSVVGLGTDIIEISRIEKMSVTAKSKLARRVLTPDELEYHASLKFPDRFLAKRWAGKEAASKALGTGIANGVTFQNFQINSLDSGQPVLILSGRAQEIAQVLGASTWHISLSDEVTYATSVVILSN